MKIHITATLDMDFWGDLDELTDEEVIELAKEDVLSLLDGARWTVERDEEC